MHDEDIGYSKTSLQWTYHLPTTGRLTTAKFLDEYKSIGERAREILNAAKRKLINSRPHSIRNAIVAIRKCCNAISSLASDSDSVDEWMSAFEHTLRNDSSIEVGTQWTYFQVMAPILREVARVRGHLFEASNPFQRRSFSEKPLLHGEKLVPMIAQARRDAYSIVTSIRSPDPAHVPYIERAKELADGKLLIPGDVITRRKTPAVQLADEWFRSTQLDLSYLTMHLYPSADHLLPFLLLLSFPLAANPDSMSLLRRSAIVPGKHPTKGDVLLLSLDKPRAGEIPQCFVTDGGSLSGGWLLRAVLEMTTPLLKLASDNERDYVFLCGTRAGNVTPLIGSIRYLAMRRYLSEYGLDVTTLRALRSARLTDEWIDRRDPFRVWRLHGGSDLAIVAAYVIRAESEKHDAISIADVQRSMIDMDIPHKAAVAAEPAMLPTHKCLNVFDPEQEKDEHGFCASYLWPYNDVHFVLGLEPRAIAFLLRDYETLCEAEKAISPHRFNKMYAAKKRLIETEFLPLIDDDLMGAARALMPEFSTSTVLIDAM